MSIQRKIGRYELIEALGQGGMGSVWRARDTILKREVALKLIRENRDSPQSRERFLREAQAAAAIQHPNLVTVFDYGQHDQSLFIAMELVAGKTLNQLLRDGPLAVESFLPLARQLTAGLQAMHARSILHRDLKPSNIVISSEGQLKILDLGLAKILEVPVDDQTADLSLTAHRAVVGTLPYMSPEQISGEKLDFRSDLYSLGLIFYEMLTGQRLLEGSSSVAIIRKMVDPDISALSRVKAPKFLRRLIARLLAQNPADRLNSITEVAAALEAPRSQLRTALLTGAAALTIILGVSQIRSCNLLTPPSAARTAAEVIAHTKQLLLRYDRPGASDQAAEMLEALIQNHPKHGAAHALLSEAYWRRYQLNRDQHWKRLAVQEMKLALNLEPGLAHAYYLEGMFANDDTRTTDAYASLQKAVELDPSHARAWAMLAQMEAKQNKLEAARLNWQRARRAGPSDWMPAYSEGLHHYRQANYAEAESIWTQAVAAFPDNVILLRNLGAALQQQEKRDEAAIIYQRAIEAVPDASTYTNLGTLQFYSGNYLAAAQSFDRAVDLNPTSYLNWGNLGDAQLQVSNLRASATESFRKAIELTKAALEKNPEDPGLLSSLALYYSANGLAQDARLTLTRLNTRNLSAAHLYNCAVAYARLEDNVAAIETLKKAISLGYPASGLMREPALAGLHKDRNFVTLVSEK